jgi:hypothetical protein
VRRDPAAGLFPPAAALASRAVWYTLDHAHGVLTLGLLGSAPFALLLVLFLREAYESVLVPGAQVAALGRLAFGLGAIYLWRFPARLALAHWMAAQRRGERPGLLRPLGFALAQLPAALFYGGLGTLGWLLGTLVVMPFTLTLRASLALHLFAGGRDSAARAWSAARTVPIAAVGWRLSGIAGVVFLGAVLVLWTAPGSALGLAEWLLKLNVSALGEVLGLESFTWIACALALSWMAVELLWCVAFGLLAADWERLSQGSDLAAELDALESRAEVFA